MALFKVPASSEVVDCQFVEVNQACDVTQGFIYDARTRTFHARQDEVIIPSFHGSTHIGSDPIPNATCSTPGLMSEDDKCKLDAVTQTRLGVLGFLGAGFPDDGGYLQGDIILAAGSEFISLERVGNVIRFTANMQTPLACSCEECAQIFWIQDESEVNAIRPPSCNGKMPGVNSYGELKVYLLPESSILDPNNPLTLLNTKGNYPTFIFKRYDDGETAQEAELDIVLKRNSNLTTHTGWAFTPGPMTARAECVWFMGLDNDGGQIRFELLPEDDPNLLGALLYKGHTITRQAAAITDYTADILSTNNYTVRKWNILDATPSGDNITAKNVWRYMNPNNDPLDPTSPRQLVLDGTKDLLPVGTLVQLWEFQVGEVNGERLTRAFFIKEPDLAAASIWSMEGAVRFGDLFTTREEANFVGTGTALTANEMNVSDVRLFEKSEWGMTNFENPLLLADDGGVTVDSDGNSFRDPSGETLGNCIIAEIDHSIPGLIVRKQERPEYGDLNGDGVVDDEDLEIFLDSFGCESGESCYNEDADFNDDGVIDIRDLALLGRSMDLGVDKVIDRPVFLWHRQNHRNVLIDALIGRPESSDYPPIDFLLQAPVDSFDDTYVKVIRRGVITTGNFVGSPYIVVKGQRWEDLPFSGTLRVLTGVFRNSVWRYVAKAAFSGWDDDGIMLIATDEIFPFDEDFFAATGIDSTDIDPDTDVPQNTVVAELLHQDFTAPAVRLEFSVNETSESESVQLQFTVGTLDMTVPYELNKSADPADDFVRGFTPGYTVSQILTQDGLITDGVGTDVTSDPEAFRVYDGGELAIPVNGETEKWNTLRIMLRDGQVWIWWNDLLIPPSTEESAALPVPVAISTPYFPINTDVPIGKAAMRMFPGAIMRQMEIRGQQLAFNEFVNGQLEISS